MKSPCRGSFTSAPQPHVPQRHLQQVRLQQRDDPIALLRAVDAPQQEAHRVAQVDPFLRLPADPQRLGCLRLADAIISERTRFG